MARPRRIVSIAGARPNFMKIAPIVGALTRRPDQFESVLVHTGQHYDEKMSEVFFDELGIPRPDVNLEVGSGSHAQQTAAIMTRVRAGAARARQSDLVLVVGDVNSTIACALVASKLGVPVAHVEAGLRSFDRAMPEEINRVLTDQISDLLFTTEASALENLHARRRRSVASALRRQRDDRHAARPPGAARAPREFKRRSDSSPDGTACDAAPPQQRGRRGGVRAADAGHRRGGRRRADRLSGAPADPARGRAVSRPRQRSSSRIGCGSSIRSAISISSGSWSAHASCSRIRAACRKRRRSSACRA